MRGRTRCRGGLAVARSAVGRRPQGAHNRQYRAVRVMSGRSRRTCQLDFVRLPSTSEYAGRAVIL
jgi:hypothetical protein